MNQTDLTAFPQTVARSNELLALGLLTLAAAASRLYRLGNIPLVINGDEGLLGQAAIYRKTLLNTNTLRYGTQSSVDFLSGHHRVMNVPGPAAELDPVSPGVIIAAPERAEELRDFAHAHPGGTFDDIFDCQQLTLLAYQLS